MDEANEEDARPKRVEEPSVAVTLFMVALGVMLAIVIGLAAFLDSDNAISIFLHPRFDWGMAAGVGLAVLYWSPWRVLGFLPPAVTLFFAVVIAVCNSAPFKPWMDPVVHFCEGLFAAAFVRYEIFLTWKTLRVPFALQLKHVRNPWQGGMLWLFMALSGLGFIVNVLSLAIPRPWPNLFITSQIYLFYTLAIGTTAYAWWLLRRPMYELWVESWIRPMFAIRRRGPDHQIPLNGPMLVIANHACWWDPLFLADVVPRPITPIMTANFYDIWHLKPFMKHVIRAIRVPEKAVKHETPEIDEAIAALDNGECVVLFPEGYLRRKEDVPLRRFGQGVWKILKERPDTPVVACWIEGAWGSWCSWKDGPPTKNKRIDFRRRIDVGMSAPFVVPREVLENHWPARVFLMNAVSAARVHLGLEPLPEFTVTSKEPATDEDIK